MSKAYRTVKVTFLVERVEDGLHSGSYRNNT